MPENSKSAFTLIETLCVLSILCLLLILLSFFPYQKIKDSYQIKVFTDQLKSQLYYAQDRAIIRQAPVQVVFSKTGTIFFWQIDSREMISQLRAPSNLSILSSFSFYYLKDGRINDFETVFFLDDDGNYFELIFQLGSGQFDFRKQTRDQSH
ncbi:competence type IV pilus minor pilin ComGD [Facklamia miroungae]|uniref:Prepilin-type N-terminal cleavage/methylation domain-containing protein n=1 Tax=Facklamia miroungae TaxID=120956 RepID=A0A1G7U246_9LACT|nr:prepilin-type N-terminal cleavage/methylation domain-containing protein [Facklamia miroungae]SDG41672.1 prepilin-type N-terminal cleavage/methylation domain-containing protein [Facklamia miroungae]